MVQASVFIRLLESAQEQTLSALSQVETFYFWKDKILFSSGEDGDVVGLGLPFSTESEKESE